MHTICHECGATKRFLNEICPECSFKPNSIEELAKARILSEPYCFTTAGSRSFETGRSPAELEKISSDVKKGLPYDFPRDELDNVKQIVQDVESTSGRDLAQDLVKFFGPAVGLLALMFLILWLL